MFPSFVKPCLFGQAQISGAAVECLVGLVERVFEVVVLLVQERFQRDLLGLGGIGAVEEARAPDGFEPHAGVLIVDSACARARAGRRCGRASSTARGSPRPGLCGSGQVSICLRNGSSIWSRLWCSQSPSSICRQYSGSLLSRPATHFVQRLEHLLLGPLAQLAAGAISRAVLVRL